MNIWNYLWIIPVSFFFLYRLGFNPYYTAIETGNKNSMLLFPLIWYPGMFFCQLCIFRLLSETSQNIVLREKLHTAELLTEMEKKQYSLLQDNIEGTRKARHDLRHHLLAMRGYAERRDYEGCLRYIEEFLKQTDSYALKQYCDNHAVNSIISYYENTAVSSGVAVSIEIRLPSLLTVPEVDFCTILGNLLSNAVEACLRQTEGERFIRMKLGMAGRSMVTLSVVNSYSGDIREENGIFLSSHHAGEGIGTMSVRHIADQYHGITRFRYEDGVFETSVLLNPEPSGAAADRELWEVLERVNLAGFLKSEGGLDTLLTEKASNLSGGQCQRLALARALLHDSPVYIFDEATSNIDVQSENDIMREIHALAGQKTVILISHRLANVTASDNIYVMDAGNVAESGSHKELLARGGIYAKLWDTQQSLENYRRKDGAAI